MSATAMLTDSDAYAVMERVRWPDGQPMCPHCGKTGAWFIEPRNGVGRKTRTSQESQRRVWRCAMCRDQFSVIVGTPLEGTKVPLPLWIRAVELACRPDGINAYELARELGVTDRTSRRIVSVLRGTSRTVRVPKYGDRRSSPRRSRTKHAVVAPEPAYCACGCGEQTNERHLEIRHLRSVGLTNQQIADKLGLTYEYTKVLASAARRGAWPKFKPRHFASSLDGEPLPRKRCEMPWCKNLIPAFWHQCTDADCRAAANACRWSGDIEKGWTRYWDIQDRRADRNLEYLWDVGIRSAARLRRRLEREQEHALEREWRERLRAEQIAERERLRAEQIAEREQRRADRLEDRLARQAEQVQLRETIRSEREALIRERSAEREQLRVLQRQRRQEERDAEREQRALHREERRVKRAFAGVSKGYGQRFVSHDNYDEDAFLSRAATVADHAAVWADPTLDEVEHHLEPGTAEFVNYAKAAPIIPEDFQRRCAEGELVLLVDDDGCRFLQLRTRARDLIPRFDPGVAIPNQASGSAGKKSSRHRGRHARQAAALNHVGGKRKARKPRTKS